MSRTVLLDGTNLTPDLLFEIGLGNVTLDIAQSGWERIEASRRVVDEAVDEKRIVYGVSTGFGSFESVAISSENLHQLQVNLIRSHSVGVGEPLAPHQVLLVDYF